MKDKKEKIAYGYNPKSGFFTNTVICQLDPLRTLAVKETVFLLPANSTWEKPPVKNSRWTGSGWAEVKKKEPENKSPTRNKKADKKGF